MLVKATPNMMVGGLKINGRILSLLKTKKVKKRTIIVGLKSDNCSREMLIRLLILGYVMPGDNLLAVHVQELNDNFDPNTFHIHEDLCKSKQVDFQVKVCNSTSYIAELSHQVQIYSATILALGSSSSWLKNSSVSKCLKALPPTCTLLIMDNEGRILVQMTGTSQFGNKVLHSSVSSLSQYNSCDKSESGNQFQKSSSMPSSSTLYSLLQNENVESVNKALQLPHFVAAQKLFRRLATLEAKGTSLHFKLEELKFATNNFSSEFLIGEGGQSNVYRAFLENGQPAAVKVFKDTESSEEDFFREVEMLSGLRHENTIQFIGYCCNKEMHAVVYNLRQESLKRKLGQLGWSERMRVAIGVAKALDYLHSCSPPIIHRDVKSSNILLSDDSHPQLSDFGAAVVHEQVSEHPKQSPVVGTFGYMAPEYMMYGTVDEKIDVYSYGVVLLELITGKEALQTNQESNHESLVLWATSLLCCGLCERLIDPCLNEDYNKDEMKMMMIAARLCLLHSSSKRPTMKTILQLLEEPEEWLKMQKKGDVFLIGLGSNGENREVELYMHDDSDSN